MSKGLDRSPQSEWYGYFRRTIFDPTSNQQKSDVVSVVLGPKSQMKATEAREALEREITKQTGQTRPNAGAVRNRFFPLKEAHVKEETAKVKKLLIQRDLIDSFDKTPLGNFDKFTLQIHLNNLAKTNSKDRVLQIRAYLRDIFAEAVDQDFLVKDAISAELRLLPNLEEVTRGTSVLLPNATKVKSGVFASS